jgi:hypothetical protein
MAKTSAFSKAFAAARKAGKKTFSWNGKSYTTKTKEEAAPPVPKDRPNKKKPPVKGITPPSAKVAEMSAKNKPLKGPIPKKKDANPVTAGFAGSAKREKEKSKSKNVVKAK